MDELWVDPVGAGRAALGRARGEVGQTALPADLVLAARELDVDESELALGAELSRFIDDEAERIHVIYLVAALRAAARRGSTRLRLAGDDLFEALAFPEETRRFARDLEAGVAALAPLFAQAARAPLVVEDGFLYAHREWSCERRVAASLVLRLAQEGEVRQGQGEGRLTREQRAAVDAATSRSIALVSGGPGTGKTSIVVAMLRRFVEAGIRVEDIALAAPTGRAADRMARSVAASGFQDEALSAQTLHRLLGYSVRRRAFRHHEDNPISAEVVIVDESSMVDLTMFDALLRALRPLTRLVLLGDADQLPSVDAGAVFRDLCAELDGADHLTELTHSFRMDQGDPAGAAVFQLAQEANAGGPLESAMERDVRDVEFVGAERVRPDQLSALLERYWNHAAPDPRFALRAFAAPFSDADLDVLSAGFDASDDSRLLALTRSSSFGTDAINETMHRRAQTKSNIASWAQGEPLMMKRNDYELGLFNGDQGILLRVGGKRSVVFRAHSGTAPFRVFPLELVAPHLELSWCTTVHKSQGSEYERIVLVLPTVDTHLGAREIIYTAVTRARRGALLVADDETLKRMLSRRMTRQSGLRGRLAQRVDRTGTP